METSSTSNDIPVGIFISKIKYYPDLGMNEQELLVLSTKARNDLFRTKGLRKERKIEITKDIRKIKNRKNSKKYKEKKSVQIEGVEKSQAPIQKEIDELPSVETLEQELIYYSRLANYMKSEILSCCVDVSGLKYTKRK